MVGQSVQASEEEVEGYAPVTEVGKIREEVFRAKLFRGGGRRRFIAEGEEDGEEGVEGEEESEQCEFQGRQSW